MSRMGTSNQRINQSTTNSFAEASPEEKRLAERMSQLGMDQADALKQVMDATRGGAGQVNALGLNATDQAALDAAYAGGEANLRRFGQLMGQDLAGTRGLNPSDTPVSEAVLRETLPAYQQLLSDKARQGLGLGLNLAQMNQGNRQFNLQAMLGGATATPSGLGFNLNRMQQERMARNTSTQSGTNYNTGSILDQMNQGAQFRYTMHAGTNQAAQAGMGGMKMMGGM